MNADNIFLKLCLCLLGNSVNCRQKSLGRKQNVNETFVENIISAGERGRRGSRTAARPSWTSPSWPFSSAPPAAGGSPGATATPHSRHWTRDRSVSQRNDIFKKNFTQFFTQNCFSDSDNCATTPGGASPAPPVPRPEAHLPLRLSPARRRISRSARTAPGGASPAPPDRSARRPPGGASSAPPVRRPEAHLPLRPTAPPDGRPEAHLQLPRRRFSRQCFFRPVAVAHLLPIGGPSPARRAAVASAGLQREMFKSLLQALL